jgi:hypothetical protein
LVDTLKMCSVTLIYRFMFYKYSLLPNLVLSSRILKVLRCGKYFASCFWYIMDGRAINSQAHQELFGALWYQGTIINISGQHVSPMHTSSKKALINTSVQTPQQFIVGISVWLKSITKTLALWPTTAPAHRAKQPSTRLYRLRHLCHPNATVRLGNRVTGTKTVWKKSIHVKPQVMPTH